MARLARPWSLRALEGDQPFGPTDCLLSEYVGGDPTRRRTCGS